MLRRHKYYKPKPRIRQAKGGDGRKAPRTTHFNPEKAQKIVGLLFFISAFGWFAYFFLFSDNFQIKNILISGNKNIPAAELRDIITEELEKNVAGILPGNNSLVAPTSGIVDAIRKRYIVDAVSVHRKPPFGLSVDINEKLSRVVLRVKTPMRIIQSEKLPEEGEGTIATSTLKEEVSHNNVTKNSTKQEGEVEYTESLYYLDVNGIVVSELHTSTDLALVPIIEIIRASQSEPVSPGDVILSREIVEMIFSLYTSLLSSNKSISIAYVSYNPAVQQELAFATTEGWEVFLSTQIPLETQLQKLDLALGEKIKDSRSTLQYVDLRVKDRIYFK